MERACSGPLRTDSNFVSETSTAELSCPCMFLNLDAAGLDDGPNASKCRIGGENLVVNPPSSRAGICNFSFRPRFITRCVSSVQFFSFHPTCPDFHASQRRKLAVPRKI